MRREEGMSAPDERLESKEVATYLDSLDGVLD
jgi:hypothetical protein